MSDSTEKTVSYSQARRSIEHILPLGFAFTLTIFPLWLVFLLSLAAIVYGAFGSRRLSMVTFREEEKTRGYSVGKIAYAVSIFVLLLIFHSSMHVVAGAWAIMALGDSMATLSGKRWGEKNLPWNKSKTYIGSLAFFFAATFGCFGLLWYTKATGSSLESATLPILFFMAAATSMVCSLVESLDLPVNDNFLVPGIAGAMLFGLSKLLLI